MHPLKILKTHWKFYCSGYLWFSSVSMINFLFKMPGMVALIIVLFSDSANETAKRDLYGELDLLKIIPEHPNVVGLLGCCTRAEPLMVIVEYCSNGDLQGFLRSSRGIHERYYRTSYGASVPNLTAKMLLTFAWQICRGMAHLGTLKVNLFILRINFICPINIAWPSGKTCCCTAKRNRQ